MFIVQRNGLRLTKSFYWWFGILTFGALALTMHVHYCEDTPQKNSNGSTDDDLPELMKKLASKQ